VSRAPEVGDGILARRFHCIACVQCARTIEIVTPFVDTAFDHAHWALVAMTDQLPRWRDWGARPRRDVSVAFDRGSPLAHPLAIGLRAGSCSATRSCAKAGAVGPRARRYARRVRQAARFASEPALAAPGSRLLVERASAADELDVVWFAAAGDPSPSRAFTTPPAWLHSYRSRSRIAGSPLPRAVRRRLR
jgi:hypothetical protein